MKYEDQIVRVGGVGTGRIFQWAHIRVYPKLLDRASLVGFYDKNPLRTKEARDKYASLLEEYASEHPEAAEAVKSNLAELRCHDSLESLLDQVDLIDVCTTTRGRMPSAVQALEKGVHSMLEKPMARTWTEADRAVRAFNAKPGVYCQYNDDNMFDPKYRMLHDLLRQGVIGKPQSMWLIRGSALDATSVLKSQASGSENGGGCLMDYGSHGLAGAMYVLGTHKKIVKAEAVSISVLFPYRVLEGEPFHLEVDDNAQVKFLVEDPETGTWITLFLEASWSGGHIGPGKGEYGKRGGQSAGFLRIEGDEGVIDATEPDHITVTRWDGGETVIPLRKYPGETISVAHEMETFIHHVRSDTPPDIDVSFGAEVIAACGAAYYSAIMKRAVTLDEFKDFCRGFTEKYGDDEKADEAVLDYLLKPYRREQT